MKNSLSKSVLNSWFKVWLLPFVLFQFVLSHGSAQSTQVLYQQTFENYSLNNTSGSSLNPNFLPSLTTQIGNMVNKWTTGHIPGATVNGTKCLYVRCFATACQDAPFFRNEVDVDQSNSVTRIGFPSSVLPAGASLKLEFDWRSPRTLPPDPQAGMRLVYSTDNGNTWSEYPQSFLNSPLATTTSIPLDNVNFTGYNPNQPKLEIGFRWYNFSNAVSDSSIMIDNVRIVFEPTLQALSVSPQTICSGDSLTVGFNTSGFSTNTTISVELSQDPGFGSPTTLSPFTVFTFTPTKTSFSGTKKVKIPASLQTGAYFIRMASSSSIFSDPLPLFVNKTPDKPFAGSETSVCSGADPITVGTASPEDGVTYTWNVPGIAGNQPDLPTSFLTNNGITKITKSVVVTASSGGGTCVVESDPMLVNIYPLPHINLVQGSPALCDNGGSDVIKFLVQPKQATVSPQCFINAPGVTKFGNGDTTFLFNPVGLTGAQQLIYRHTFKWTNSLTCFAEETLSVKVNKAPEADPGPSESFCQGGAITLLDFPNPAAGEAARWEGIGVSPAGNFNPADNGIFIPVGQQSVTLQLSLIVSKFFADPSLTCSDTAVKPVRINRPPVVNAGVDDTLCQSNGTLPLIGYSPIGSGAQNVGTWTGPGIIGSSAGANAQNPVFTIVAPPSPSQTFESNTITYTFKNSDGCIGTDTKVITVRPNPPANAGSDRDVCSGQPTIVGGSGQPGLKYRWTEPAPQFFENPDTSASVLTLTNQTTLPQTIKAKLKVTDLFNCVSKDSVLIKVIPVPIASVILPADTEACEGDSIILKADLPATGSYNIQWLRNGFPITQVSSVNKYYVTIPGAYSVKVGYAGSVCNAVSSPVNLKFNPTLTPKIVGDKTFCGTNPTTLRAIPADPSFTYEWRLNSALFPSPGIPQVSIAKRGKLSVILRTDKGCIGYSDSVSVDSLPMPFLDRTINDTMLCENSGFFFAAQVDTFFNYRWQDSVNRNIILSDSSRFSPRIAGTYFLDIYNKCGVASDTFRILRINPAPQFGILSGGKSDTTVCLNQNYFLKAPNGYSARWSYYNYEKDSVIHSDGQAIGPLPSSKEQPYFISLLLEDNIGCSRIDTITIEVIKCPAQVFVPNAFMPVIDAKSRFDQSDQPNDNTVWFFDGYGLVSARCYIYSRWGELVFSKEGWGKANGWDGYFNNVLCPTGTYKYLIEFTGSNDNQLKRVTGNITLIR